MTEPTDDSPTLRTRALGVELRRIREQRGLTLAQVEQELNRSAGWGSRIENGKRRMPSVNDVTALLDLYEVTDPAVRKSLLDTTRQARTRGWWNTYRDTIPEAYATYVGLEAGARKLYIANPSIVPGLLQTADYARAVIGAGGLQRGLTADQVEKRVEVRAKRQELITRNDPIALRAVLDEAALRRIVGGPTVMREQLEFLLGIAERPNVTIQVVPFSAGAHAAVTCGFTILEFPGYDHDIVAIETLVGSLFIERPDEVDPHVEAFRDLHSAALAEPDSLQMIAETAAKY
jgi:transcriptional regulator with XRE-family HTH domain